MSQNEPKTAASVWGGGIDDGSTAASYAEIDWARRTSEVAAAVYAKMFSPADLGDGVKYATRIDAAYKAAEAFIKTARVRESSAGVGK